MNWSIFLTIVSGTAVFVLGQLLLKLFIEPIQEHRRVKAKIVHALTYFRWWRNYYFVPAPKTEADKPEWDKKMGEANLYLRDLASNLRTSVASIPFYGCFSRVGLVIPKK